MKLKVSTIKGQEHSGDGKGRGGQSRRGEGGEGGDRRSGLFNQSFVGWEKKEKEVQGRVRGHKKGGFLLDLGWREGKPPWGPRFCPHQQI